MNKMKTNIDQLIQTIEQIPTLPIIHKKVMGIIEDDNGSLERLAEVIEKDQALATKILKVANSAFCGLLSNVSSIDHALVLLGTNEVKSILLGISVYDFFPSNEKDALDRTQFWRHSIICSQVAKFLGKQFHCPNAETLFLAGLIHDIGKIVVDQYFHEEFLRIIDYVSSNNSAFSKAEKQVLGTTHYQIAAKLLKQWNFPKKIIMEVLYHHAPWHDKNFVTSSSIIYLANIFAKIAGYSFLPNEKRIDPYEFSNTPEFAFIINNGFDFDYQTIKNMIIHIQEFITAESENVMRLFEE